MAAPKANAAVSVERVVRLGIAELEQRLHVHRATISRWLKAGAFPQPEYLSERRSWRLAAIEAWERKQAARPPEARRGARNLDCGDRP